MNKYALLSVFDKVGIDIFATQLVALGFTIISSGGTGTFLRQNGVEVVDLSDFTGYPAILDHRVVTLYPQVHAALLATKEMLPELEKLGWPPIDLVRVDFYPLEAELDRDGATFESCIAKTDIGGPAMIRSANKGGRAIPIISKAAEGDVINWLKAGRPNEKQFLFQLRRAAEQAVVEYTIQSAEVYHRFGCFEE